MDRKNNSLKFGILCKNIILECFSNTTFHALPNIVKPNNHLVLKLIWFVCLLACAVYCFINCVSQFEKYYSYPTSIMISNVQEVPTDFPVISICNIKLLNRSNPYTISYMSKTPEVKLASHYLLRFVFSNDKTLSFENRTELGFKIEDMLVFQPPNYWCNYNNDFCDPSHFTYFYNQAYGNCYSFNIGYYSNGTKYKIKKSSTSDKMYGLMIALFVGDPIIDTVKEESDGVVISIHNQSIAPFTKGKPILVPSGAETDLIINRNYITKLASPYGDCLDDTSENSSFTSQYFDYIVRTLKQGYTQEYCYSFCLQKQTIKYCGCSNSYLPVFLNTKEYCANVTQYSCVWSVNEKYGNEFTDHCKSSCPFECFSIEYKVASSRALYPTVYKLNSLLYKYNYSQRITNIQYASQAFLRLNIYYDSMEYTTTTETAQMLQADLFSNFGGTLGLFLGIAVTFIIMTPKKNRIFIHEFKRYYSKISKSCGVMRRYAGNLRFFPGLKNMCLTK